MIIEEDIDKFNEETVLITPTGKDFMRSDKVLLTRNVNGKITGRAWLDESFAASEILPPDNFLLLRDEFVQEKFQFLADDAIADGNAAHQQGGILRLFNLHLVQGTNQWKPNHLNSAKSLLKSSGANVIDYRELGDYPPETILILVASEGHAAGLMNRSVDLVITGGGKKITWQNFADAIFLQTILPFYTSVTLTKEPTKKPTNEDVKGIANEPENEPPNKQQTVAYVQQSSVKEFMEEEPAKKLPTKRAKSTRSKKPTEKPAKKPARKQQAVASAQQSFEKEFTEEPANGHVEEPGNKLPAKRAKKPPVKPPNDEVSSLYFMRTLSNPHLKTNMHLFCFNNNQNLQG